MMIAEAELGCLLEIGLVDVPISVPGTKRC